MNPPQVAHRLFAPIADSYERWARVLSLGQDERWRSTMVDALDLPQGAFALDLAAGTGSITRRLEGAGARVMAIDQSREMLSGQREHTGCVLATAERLPIRASSVDAATFGYLLRYVDDVPSALTEITRVVRPGGRIGMVEFGRPRGLWGLAWMVYTRLILPWAGRLIGNGWQEVGRFLGNSIDEFARTWPPAELAEAWRAAGMTDVEYRRMSLGGGLVMWGTRR